MIHARRAVLLPAVAALGAVILSAAPASATVRATWVKPTDNSTFTTTNPVDFVVSLDRGGSTLVAPDGAAVTMSLAIPGPYPGPYAVATSSGSSSREMKFTFTPACSNHNGACPSDGAPAYNGRYTATLSGAATGSRTVVFQVPPATPAGVTAVATGQRKIKVSWNANLEPDLTGYSLFTSDGSAIARHLPTSQLSYEFTLGSTGYGGEHSFVVVAHRLACTNCGGADGGQQLDSPLSSPASVTLDEPEPAPAPAEEGPDGYGYGDNGNGTGNGGNGKGNGSGATPNTDPYSGNNTTTGGTTTGNAPVATSPQANQRAAFGVTFKQFSPTLGAPKLPPQPKFAPAPIPEGTYDPTLAYGDQTIIEEKTVASGGGITSELVDTLGAAFEGHTLYRSIAIALLLLLAAAHLRLWMKDGQQA